MLYPSLISRLKSQHTSIDILIADLDNDRLTYRPEPGKWNICDNIAHLTVYQPMFINRINSMLVMENPVFDPYKADNDEVFLSSREWPTDKLLTKLYDDRESLYELIISLSDRDLNKMGTHLTYGTMNVSQWAEFFLLHEAHHQFTIFKLAQSSN